MDSRDYPLDSQARHDAEAAEYAAMDDTAAVMNPTGATIAAADFDARLIREARELATTWDAEGRRAWLVAHGRPEAAEADYAMLTALHMGAMSYALSVLANGYERELKRNA